MDKTVKLTVDVSVPRDSLVSLFQYLKAFDQRHPGTHFMILPTNDASEIAVYAEAAQILPMVRRL